MGFAILVMNFSTIDDQGRKTHIEDDPPFSFPTRTIRGEEVAGLLMQEYGPICQMCDMQVRAVPPNELFRFKIKGDGFVVVEREGDLLRPDPPQQHSVPWYSELSNLRNQPKSPAKRRSKCHPQYHPEKRN